MCKTMILLVRTDTDIDEHERLSNISLIHSAFIAVLHYTGTVGPSITSRTQWFVKKLKVLTY